MIKKADSGERDGLTRGSLTLVAWSVIFYTAVSTYYIYSKYTAPSEAGEYGILAISVAVFFPLFGIAYGIMAGIFQNGRGWMLCFADAVFSAILICLIWDADEIYGRLAVCLFVGAAVFSFTAIVKSVTEFVIFLKKRE